MQHKSNCYFRVLSKNDLIFTKVQPKDWKVDADSTYNYFI